MAPRPNRSEAIRRRRSAPSSDAHLDDLFDPVDEEPAAVEPVPPRDRPWLITSVLQTFAASAVLYTGFHVYDLAPSYPLLVAVSAGAVLVRQATVATREAGRPRTRDLVRPRWEQFGPAPARVEQDGLRQSVDRWARRLDSAASSPDRFGRSVIVALGEIADERLRQRHALTRASDPGKARELLGEELWQLLQGGSKRVPAPARVSAALGRLEAL